MKNRNALSPAGPSGPVARGDDRAVSELVGTVILIAVVVAVVAVVVAVVAPQLRSLREQGTVEAASAEMERLGQRIVDLSRSGSPRSEQARIDLPAGRLDALRDRTCWTTTATVPGPERLNFTLTGVGDGDARYGIAVHGTDGVGNGSDDPSDLVVEASVWRGNQRRALADSRVFEVRPVRHLVLGGEGATSDLDEIVTFDPEAGSAGAEAATLPTARAEVAAVWAPARRHAYVFGGTDGGDEVVAYAPQNDTAWVVGTLPRAVEDAAAVWAPERDTAYLFGGDAGGSATDAIVAWTPANGTAWQVASLPTTRTAASAVWDPSRGHAYLLGGRATVGGSDLATITAFAPANGTAWDRSELAAARAETGAAWDPGREVAYLFGGAGPQDTVYAWDPATGQTTEPASLPAPRAAVSATWDDDQELAYVFGGLNGLDAPTTDIVAFDPATGSASTLTTLLPSARSATAAVAAGTGNGSLSLATREGTPVPPCTGRVRLRVVDTATGNVTGEAWVLSSGGLRWQAPLQGGLHAVELLFDGRVVETPASSGRLADLGAFGAAGSSVTIDAVRLTVPDEVPTTVGAGPVTVPLRGMGAFSLADGARGNVTLAFHGAWNATLRDHVLDGTAFRDGPGGTLMRPGPVTLTAVDRPVRLPEGLDAR